MHSPKAYEQSICFLRVIDGSNILDKTGIHPESYDIANNLLDYLKLNIDNINEENFKNLLKSINTMELADKLKTDEYTIKDIVSELLNPGLDPRDTIDPPILRSDILKITDLKKGMKLKGTVRNVASFGAFIDIGLHDDGLLHISKMSKTFVKDPTEVVRVGEILDVYIDDIDLKKNRVSLSLLEIN